MYYIEKVRRNGLLPHVELKCISTRFDIQLMVKSSVCFAKMPLIHCSQLLKCEYFLIFSGFCVVDHPKQKKCYVNVCLRSSCQIYLTIVLLAALSVTCAWFSVDHSVFQVQTPGRGWTLVCQSSLLASPCSTWLRENPTTSVCAAATLLVWASLRCPQERSQSEINWVSENKYHQLIIQLSYFNSYLQILPDIVFCLIPICYFPSFLTGIIVISFLFPYFLNRPALNSGQSSGHQEHRHLSGGLLGGL